MSKLIAACVQVNAGSDFAPNLRAAADLVRRARDKGAELICTPENVSLIVQGREKALAIAPTEDQHPALPIFTDLARETGAHILVGSLAIKVEPERLANRSYLVAPTGEIVARYDKVHLFDVDLENGESYRESATIRPGDRAVLAPTPWGPLGMSICYDLRFAYLYRKLAQSGATLLTIPSAFTVPTGRAHWHALVRARAIETGCFVLAPAQCGTHDAGRKTYGHSLIVSPWGEVLAEAGEEPGIIVAELDMDKVAEARQMVPSLRHDREITI